MENTGIIGLSVLTFLLGIFMTIAFVPANIVEVEKQVLVPGEVQIVKVPGVCNETPSNIEIPSINNDIYNKMFEDEIDELEQEGLDAYNAEFDEDDLEDFMEGAIVNFDKQRSCSEDEDEEVITIIDLGLNDDEDKVVKIYKEYKVKYELDDSSDELKKVVIAEGIVTYDEEDGFECEIEFSLK